MAMVWYRSHDTLPLYEQDRDVYIETPVCNYSGRGEYMWKKNLTKGEQLRSNLVKKKNSSVYCFHQTQAAF